jgi:hypothetical protein
MTLRPISSYLTRFDEPAPPAAPPSFGDAFSFSDAVEEAGEPPSFLDMETPEGEETLSLAPPEPVASEAEIRALVEAELRAEFDAALEKEKAAAADRLAAERRKWSMEEGGRIGARFHHALEIGVAAIRGDLEQILEPFVTREILERLLKDFMARLRARLADEDNPTLQLSGPPDLLEIIAEKLKSEKIETEIVESDAIDVTARIGDTLLETRMEEWINRIREEAKSE